MNRINELGGLLLLAARRGNLSEMNVRVSTKKLYCVRCWHLLQAVVLQSYVENVREAVLNWEDEKGETPLIAAVKANRIKSVTRVCTISDSQFCESHA